MKVIIGCKYNLSSPMNSYTRLQFFKVQIIMLSYLNNEDVQEPIFFFYNIISLMNLFINQFTFNIASDPSVPLFVQTLKLL